MILVYCNTYNGKASASDASDASGGGDSRDGEKKGCVLSI